MSGRNDRDRPDRRRRDRSRERDGRDNLKERDDRERYPRRRSRSPSPRRRSRSPRRGGGDKDRRPRDHRDYRREKDDDRHRDNKRDEHRPRDSGPPRDYDRPSRTDRPQDGGSKDTYSRSDKDVNMRPNLDPDAPDEEGQAEDDPEAAMMAAMGMGGFGTTKGKKVNGNQEGGVDIKKTRTWRQYMNRRGGFNRPLDKIK